MAYKKESKEQIKTTIIDSISIGKSLKSILEEVDGMPARQTVYNWLNKNHEDFDAMFLDNYARAREESADLDAENIQEIAEKTLRGVYDHQAARVAIDAYKWNASKKQPKKYGDKMDLTVDDKRMTPEERAKRIEELKSKL